MVAHVGRDITTYKMAIRLGGAWHDGIFLVTLCSTHLQRHIYGSSVPKSRRFDMRALPARPVQMCTNQAVNGVTRDGGFGEVRHAPRRRPPCAFLVTSTRPRAAPFLCAGVTVYNGIRQMGIRQGELVAIKDSAAWATWPSSTAVPYGLSAVVISRGTDKQAVCEAARRLGIHRRADPGCRSPPSRTWWRCVDRDDGTKPSSDDPADLRPPARGSCWSWPRSGRFLRLSFDGV